MQVKRSSLPPDIDQWLEAGLRHALDPLANVSAPPSRYARDAGAGRPHAHLRLAAFAATMIAGLVALTAVGASAATGSINPVDWGRHVSHAVDACKRALPATDHGIGECVSEFVASDGHSAAGAPAAKPAITPAAPAVDPGSSARAPGDGPHGASGPLAPGRGGASPGTGAGSTGNPHSPANPQGNPHTPQNPTGNPRAHPTPPGHGGAIPGAARGKAG